MLGAARQEPGAMAGLPRIGFEKQRQVIVGDKTRTRRHGGGGQERNGDPCPQTPVRPERHRSVLLYHGCRARGASRQGTASPCVLRRGTPPPEFRWPTLRRTTPGGRIPRG